MTEIRSNALGAIRTSYEETALFFAEESRSKISVVIATLNEEEGIGPTIGELRCSR